MSHLSPTPAVGPLEGRVTSAGHPGEPVLAVKRLSVDLGGKTVLSEVGFELRRGEVAGLIGSNGAGKTTLIKAVLGLIRPSAGSVVRQGSTRSAPQVGYVPQRLAIDPETPIRVKDLVALGYDGHRYGVPLPSAKRSRAVQRALEAVGVASLALQRVGRLSGGETQRVLIAHALVSDPALVLLDEPLSNLDLKAAQEVVELLRRLADELGLAVLMSSHELNPLLGKLDKVIYLAQGRSAAGPVEEVVTSEVLSRLYGHPVEVVRAAGRLLVLPGADDDRGCGPCAGS